MVVLHVLVTSTDMFWHVLEIEGFPLHWPQNNSEYAILLQHDYQPVSENSKWSQRGYLAHETHNHGLIRSEKQTEI